MQLPQEPKKAIDMIEKSYDLDKDDEKAIYLYAMSGTSEFQKSTLAYISGFVHRRIMLNESCVHCQDFFKNTTIRFGVLN